MNTINFEQGHTYILTGTLRGPIWEPGFICEKEFDKRFEVEQRAFVKIASNLIEAADQVLKDGDFQHCQFVELTLVDCYWERNNKLVQEFTKIDYSYLPANYFADYD